MRQSGLLTIPSLVLMTCLVGQGAAHKQATFDAEVIHVTPKGLIPSSFKRAAGPLAIIVRNESSLKDVSISVQRRGSATADIQKGVDEAKGAASGILDLQPGVYDVTVAGQPKLQCTITVH